MTRGPCRPTPSTTGRRSTSSRGTRSSCSCSCSWRASRPDSQRPGLPTWEDAVTNQRLIQAAYRSVAERREVAPEEIPLARATRAAACRQAVDDRDRAAPAAARRWHAGSLHAWRAVAVADARGAAAQPGGPGRGARRRRSARRRSIPGSRRRSTGTPRWPSGATCGTSGFSVAEAMDTAQRGTGLDWPVSRELIRRSLAEARACGAADRIACGAGTDQLPDGPDFSLDR